MKKTKKPYTFRFNIELIEKIRKLAIREHRELTNYIENLFIKDTNGKK